MVELYCRFTTMEDKIEFPRTNHMFCPDEPSFRAQQTTFRCNHPSTLQADVEVLLQLLEKRITR